MKKDGFHFLEYPKHSSSISALCFVQCNSFLNAQRKYTTMASSSLSSCSTSIPMNRNWNSSRISPPSYYCKFHNSQILNLKTLAFPIAYSSPKSLASSPITCSSLFSSSSSIRSHCRRVFSELRASLPDSAEPSGEEEENKDKQDDIQAEESEADLKFPVPNVDELIKAYKEAVLSGDDKTIADIEAKLCIIENQKNELVLRLLSLQAEMTSGKERYIRLQADFDNFRKRSDKEKLTITSDAKGEVMERLLAMVDSFDQARQQIKTETDKEEKIDKSYQGIYKQFVEVMKSLKVSPIPTVGKPFDPSIHEAVAREASEKFKAGIVIQEFRRGFLLGDRVLRPATVKVSTGSAKGVPSVPEKSEQAVAIAAALDES